MASAAQTVEGRSSVRAVLPCAQLRCCGTSGCAAPPSSTSVAIVALPGRAVITGGLRDGLTSLREALAISVRVGGDPPHADHVGAGRASINAVMGTALAYVLVRFRFPGRRLLSSIVDLPLAIPTLVTGLMLVALYGPNGVDRPMARKTCGIQVVFTPLGVLLALLVVTLPLVVRNVHAGAAGARPRGGRGGLDARRERVDVVPAGRAPRDQPGGGGRHPAHVRAMPGRVRERRARLRQPPGPAPSRRRSSSSSSRTSSGRPEAAAVATLLFAISFVLVLVTARLTRRREET